MPMHNNQKMNHFYKPKMSKSVNIHTQPMSTDLILAKQFTNGLYKHQDMHPYDLTAAIIEQPSMIT